MTTVLALQLANDASLFWILVIIAACFVVMALSLAFVALMVSRVVAVVGQLQQKVEPLLLTANNLSRQGQEIVEKGKDIADKGREIAEKFTQLSEHLTNATKHLSESAGLIKDELGEIKLLIGQTAETAKEKVALVSQTIDRTNGQVIETADFIQTKVVEPARELAAIMAGVRKGLEVLLAPSPKQIDNVYNNDELFIG